MYRNSFKDMIVLLKQTGALKMKKFAAVMLSVSVLFSGMQTAHANNNALKIIAGVVAVGGAAYLANQYSESRQEKQQRLRQARYENQQNVYGEQYGYNNQSRNSNCRIVKKPVQIAEDTYKLVKVRECYNNY